MAKSVLVAMSGGVDSSVAALLLKQQGYDVVGAHMKLWDYAEVGADIHRDGRCCSLDAVNDCRAICDSIDAPFYVLNLSRQFREVVIDNFVDEYKAGRTPNPCVRCNTNVKWEPFLQKAREIGCDLIATGHYAQIERGDDNRFLIRKGVDDSRDQSYFLWGLQQDALAMTLMPLGGMHKTEVREFARKHGLKTAEKAESREICFVADDDYHRFLREWDEKHDLSPTSGDIVNESGDVLGQHDGAAYYTIGQRRGLGLSHPTPLYVLDIDAANNRVVVGDDSSLLRSEMVVEKVNWIATAPPSRLPRRPAQRGTPRNDVQGDDSDTSSHPERSRRGTNDGTNVGRNPCPEGVVLSAVEGRGSDTARSAKDRLACHPERSRRGIHDGASPTGGPLFTVGSVGPTMNGGPPKTLNVQVKIRYQHPPASAQLVLLTDNTVRVTFDDKQRAITPGQSAVFYDDDVLLGGGLIK